MSKNPWGFCFEERFDHKITAGIEYFHDNQAGIILAQKTNYRLEIIQEIKRKTKEQIS